MIRFRLTLNLNAKRKRAPCSPRLLITLGDVAGIGPEIVVKAWPSLVEICRPIVVGDVGWLRRAQTLTGFRGKIVAVAQLERCHAQCGRYSLSARQRRRISMAVVVGQGVRRGGPGGV